MPGWARCCRHEFHKMLSCNGCSVQIHGSEWRYPLEYSQGLRGEKMSDAWRKNYRALDMLVQCNMNRKSIELNKRVLLLLWFGWTTLYGITTVGLPVSLIISLSHLWTKYLPPRRCILVSVYFWAVNLQPNHAKTKLVKRLPPGMHLADGL